jgi:transposase-like protein
MSRPRDPNVLEELQDCPIHGRVTFRRHKHGRTRAGAQRWRWVCVTCHNVRQIAAYHAGKGDAS